MRDARRSDGPEGRALVGEMLLLSMPLIDACGWGHGSSSPTGPEQTPGRGLLDLRRPGSSERACSHRCATRTPCWGTPAPSSDSPPATDHVYLSHQSDGSTRPFARPFRISRPPRAVLAPLEGTGTGGRYLGPRRRASCDRTVASRPVGWPRADVLDRNSPGRRSSVMRAESSRFQRVRSTTSSTMRTTRSPRPGTSKMSKWVFPSSMRRSRTS